MFRNWIIWNGIRENVTNYHDHHDHDDGKAGPQLGWPVWGP